MSGLSPNEELWRRINDVIAGENADLVLHTLISGTCSVLLHLNMASDQESARVSLAAILLSPSTADYPGSLAWKLPAEFRRLSEKDTDCH